MSKIIVSEHITPDRFVAGPNGEMGWIQFMTKCLMVNEFTNSADTALYGRLTYGMMETYWPTAADKPNATKHDIEHSNWYNKSEKVVLSRTIKEKKEKTIFY